MRASEMFPWRLPGSSQAERSSLSEQALRAAQTELNQARGLQQARLTETTRAGYDRKLRAFARESETEACKQYVTEAMRDAREKLTARGESIPADLWRYRTPNWVGEKGIEWNLASAWLESYSGLFATERFLNLKEKAGNTPKTLDGHRSAIVHVFRETSQPVPTTLASSMSNMVKGARRNHARLLVNGARERNAKDPLPVTVFHSMCASLFDEGATFDHLVLLTTWSALNRISETLQINLKALSVNEDAIILDIPLSKKNQEGTRELKVRMYANPLRPKICVFLSLALYLAGGGGDEDGRLFPGGHQRSRFSKTFKKRTREDSNGDKVSLKLGTHSLRKGAGTFLASGTTAGPSITAIMNRAQWSTGDSFESYLKLERAGDALCGRIAAGLDPLKSNFSVLPSHFHTDSEEQRDEVQAAAVQVFGEAKVQLLGKDLAALLLASLVHHLDFLVSENHHLLQDRVLTQVLENMKAVPLNGAPLESPVMTATGIPPITVSLQKLEEIQSQFREREQAFEASLRGLERTVRESIENTLSAHADAHGTVSRAWVAAEIGELRSALGTDMKAALANAGFTPASENPTETQAPPLPAPAAGLYYHEERGVYSRLPPGFELRSKNNLAASVSLYFRGCHFKGTKIAPLKDLKTGDFGFLVEDKRSKQQKLLSAYRTVALWFIETLQEMDDFKSLDRGDLVTRLQVLSPGELLQLANKVTIPRAEKRRKTRDSDVTVFRLAKLIQKSGFRTKRRRS